MEPVVLKSFPLKQVTGIDVGYELTLRPVPPIVAGPTGFQLYVSLRADQSAERLEVRNANLFIGIVSPLYRPGQFSILDVIKVPELQLDPGDEITDYKALDMDIDANLWHNLVGGAYPMVAALVREGFDPMRFFDPNLIVAMGWCEVTVNKVTALATPTLIAPQHNATVYNFPNGFWLEWSRVEDADGYSIEFELENVGIAIQTTDADGNFISGDALRATHREPVEVHPEPVVKPTPPSLVPVRCKIESSRAELVGCGNFTWRVRAVSIGEGGKVDGGGLYSEASNFRKEVQFADPQDPDIHARLYKRFDLSQRIVWISYEYSDLTTEDIARMRDCNAEVVMRLLGKFSLAPDFEAYRGAVLRLHDQDMPVCMALSLSNMMFGENATTWDEFYDWVTRTCLGKVPYREAKHDPTRPWWFREQTSAFSALGAPGFRAYLCHFLEQMIRAGADIIHLDEYFQDYYPDTDQSAGFDEHAISAFTRYLIDKFPDYTAQDWEREFGITGDINSFNYIDYLKQRGILTEQNDWPLLNGGKEGKRFWCDHPDLVAQNPLYRIWGIARGMWGQNHPDNFLFQRFRNVIQEARQFVHELSGRICGREVKICVNTTSSCVPNVDFQNPQFASETVRRHDQEDSEDWAKCSYLQLEVLHQLSCDRNHLNDLLIEEESGTQRLKPYRGFESSAIGTVQETGYPLSMREFVRETCDNSLARLGHKVPVVLFIDYPPFVFKDIPVEDQNAFLAIYASQCFAAGAIFTWPVRTYHYDVYDRDKGLVKEAIQAWTAFYCNHRLLFLGFRPSRALEALVEDSIRETSPAGQTRNHYCVPTVNELEHDTTQVVIHLINHSYSWENNDWRWSGGVEFEIDFSPRVGSSRAVSAPDGSLVPVALHRGPNGRTIVSCEVRQYTIVQLARPYTELAHDVTVGIEAKQLI